jgi:hypothetical protein
MLGEEDTDLLKLSFRTFSYKKSQLNIKKILKVQIIYSLKLFFQLDGGDANANSEFFF